MVCSFLYASFLTNATIPQLFVEIFLLEKWRWRSCIIKKIINFFCRTFYFRSNNSAEIRANSSSLYRSAGAGQMFLSQPADCGFHGQCRCKLANPCKSVRASHYLLGFFYVFYELCVLMAMVALLQEWWAFQYPHESTSFCALHAKINNTNQLAFAMSGIHSSDSISFITWIISWESDRSLKLSTPHEYYFIMLLNCFEKRVITAETIDNMTEPDRYSPWIT